MRIARCTVTPAADEFGTSTITVTVTDAGLLTATDTFVLTVNAVNDAPSFTKGAEPDGGRRTPVRRRWPAGRPRISAGPANESGQTLDFIVTNNNNALFSVQPAVAPNGTLTYTPAADANGTATVTVQIHDNGGTANGGVDTSAIQTFTITVTAVNTRRRSPNIADQTIIEDARPGAIAFTGR